MADNTPTSANSVLNGAAAQAKTPEEIAKEYDLLPKLLPHLDRHLIFPLLQFVADQEDEPSSETTKAKYELLKTTNMTDYVASLYCEIEGLEEPPAQFAKKRQEVLDRLEQYEQESAKITDLLSREDVITNLRSDKVANLEYLKKEHEVFYAPLYIKGRKLMQYRSRLKWSTSYTISVTSNTAAVTMAQQQNCYTSSVCSPPIMIRSRPQPGESWLLRF
jgi:hypothetical protein